MTTPIAGPWDSPHVVIRNASPKLFPAIICQKKKLDRIYRIKTN
jgi:hypothetical protein